MQLIGINGFAESGKDTTFEFIKLLTEVTDNPDEVAPEERVERRAFADNLKIMAMYALGYEGSDEYLIETANLLKAGGTIDVLVPVQSPARSFTEKRLNGRKYLQHFGVRAREVFGDTFWIDQVLPKPEEKHLAYSNKAAVMIEEFKPIWGTVGRKGEQVGLPAIGCVTDVRFENEGERVKTLNGCMVEIINPRTQSDGHSSEQPLPRHLIDYVIVNDGTLLELEEKVAAFLAAIR